MQQYYVKDYSETPNFMYNSSFVLDIGSKFIFNKELLKVVNSMFNISEEGDMEVIYLIRSASVHDSAFKKWDKSPLLK